MNGWHYNITKDNTFEEKNKLGPEYHTPNYILEKPGGIKNLQQIVNNKPLAGRFGEIGERIFE